MVPESMTNEQLVLRIQTGVDVAENMLKLWEQNQGLIYKIAKRFQGHEEIEDLLQQGYLGLCDAVDGYDPENGTPFISYAAYWIRQVMQRYIQNCGQIVRMPVHVHTDVRRYKKYVSSYQVRFNRKPTDWEACRYLEISEDKLDRLKAAIRIGDVGSLDVPIGDEDEGTAYDLLPGEESPEDAIIDKMVQEQLKATLWGMVDSLPDQQPEIIRMIYQEGKTTKEAGKALDLNYNQAKRQQAKAINTLQHPTYSNELEPYLYDKIYSRGLRGNGVKRFRETWTSSTERTALKLIGNGTNLVLK